MYDLGAKRLKLKKFFAVVLACCISFTVLVLPASAENNIIPNNSAKYYAYVYDQLLKYRNGDIDLGSFLGNTYSKYMDTGVDNIGQAFTNIADIVKSLTPFSDDKWNDWYLDNKMGGGGGGGNRDDSVLNGYGAVLRIYDPQTNKLYDEYFGNAGLLRNKTDDSVGYYLKYSLHNYYDTNGLLSSSKVENSNLSGDYYFSVGNFQFLGNWRYDNGDEASDIITELPEKEIPSYDDNSVPEDDLIDFLEDLLNDLMLQFPDLSTIEGLLRAILAKLGTLDSDNDNELLMQILTAIQALKNSGETADNSELLKTLEELKNSLSVKDGEKVTSLAELLNQLVQNQVRRSDITIDPSLYNQRYSLIETKLLGKFSFISEIKNFVQYAIDSYSSSSENPSISISLFGLTHSMDFSAFDDNIDLIRFCVAAFVYLTFAFNTFRRIPGYINGGDNE